VATDRGNPPPRWPTAQADPGPTGPPSEQVRRCLGAWRRIGASPWVLDTLAHGIHLPWVSPPPRQHAKGYLVAPRDREFLEGEPERGLANGFYRELSRGEAARAHGVVGAFVTWSAGKPRMVIDYRHPNKYLSERKFKYESLYDLAPQLHPGDALLSWDIKDAFFHLELQPRDRTFLCFTVLGRVFEPVVMPFGLRLAPYFWATVCRPVVAELRRMGFRIVSYVDDFGGAPPSQEGEPATILDALKGGGMVRGLLDELGLMLHPKKGVWTGPTSLPLLGHLVDTQRGLFILRPERAAKIMGLASSLCRRAASHRRWVRAKALRCFCGMAVSTTLSVTTARYHLRSLYNTLGGTLTGDVRLTHQCLRDLQWWATLTKHAGLGRSLWPPDPKHVLHTDASLSGWGAVLDGALPARGFHSPVRRGAHINELELVTVRMALESFRQFLTERDTWLLIKSDSTVTVGVMNSLSSKSRALMRELRRLHELCEQWGLSLRAEHLPSAVNAYADKLSRQNDSTDWSLPVRTFEEMERRFGPHTVDLFASNLNTRCGRFYSRVWSPGCAGIRALQHDWRSENCWANPPFHLVGAVVDKAIRSGCQLPLVAPRWPAQPWYWRAAEACTEHLHLEEKASRATHGNQTSPAKAPSWGVDIFRFGGSRAAHPRPYAGSASFPGTPART